MGTLKEKAQSILTEKNNKIIPGNIKKNVKIFDVTGTLDNIDTSDATALETDIAEDKTAYVDGQKVLGTLKDYRGACGTNFGSSEVDEKDDDNNRLVLNSYISDSSAILDNEVQIPNYLPYSEITDKIGLTPDKIKLGEKVLGITGTYSGTLVKIPIAHEEQHIVIDFSKIADVIESYIEDVPEHANFVIETDESDTLNPFIRIATMTYGMAGESMTKPALALSINQTREAVTLVYVNYDMNGTKNVQTMGIYSVQSTDYMDGDMTLTKLVNLFNFIEEGYIDISSNAEIYNDFDNVYFCFSNPSTGESYTILENIDSSFIRIEDK